MAMAAEEGTLGLTRREKNKNDKQRTNHHADEHFCAVELGCAARGDERNAACVQVRASFSILMRNPRCVVLSLC
jgi:hypothetical protein